MSAGSRPRPTCQHADPVNVQDGTSCLAPTPIPQPLGLCTRAEPSGLTPGWGYLDVIIWKVLPSRIGGAPDLLRKYKDNWVRAQRDNIKTLSARYRMPPELLAGVAWIEAGGKPYSSKILMYDLRTVLHPAEPLIGNLTVARPPDWTSMGPVAIQLRRAAATMDIDFNELSGAEKWRLIECLQIDENDLAIVARHLWQLKQIDFPDPAPVGAQEIRIIGARYNRGPELPLSAILKDTSYGDFIINRIYPRLQTLLYE